MQPLQDDWRDPAAKDNGITHAATARSNLDAAITMRSAETELQNTIELRATASEIVAPKPDLDAVKLLIEGFPYPPWFLFWKKSFTLGGSMLKPFLGNCAQITGKNPSSRFKGCPGTCCSFKICITYIMYIV